MALEAFVESVESLPEAVQGEYKQVEGGFQLDVNPVNGLALENVEGLKSALGKERVTVSTLSKDLKKIKKEFDGVDPLEVIGAKAELEEVNKTYNKLKSKYDELASIDPEKQADELATVKANELISKEKKSWEKEFKKEVSSREERLQTLSSQLHEVMIQSEATRILAENGAGDSLDLLLPHILKSAKLVENEGKVEVQVVDSEGTPRVRGDGKNMVIKDLIPEYKEKWPNAFDASIKPGGGTKPNGKPIDTKSGQNQLSGVDKINAGLKNLKK